MATVKGDISTPHAARVALAEASRQAGRVHRSDKLFRAPLLIITLAYVGTGVVLGLFPRGGSPVASSALIVIFFGGLAWTVTLTYRIRPYSQGGLLRFLFGCAAFSLWNAAVIWASISTGWWGARQPGFHATTSFIAASIPLVVAAWLIGRVRG